ncbi:hypothetical protein ILUMI_00349 [Ignelater luminosus]|uniref:Cytochrome c oxidase assembly protein COX11, mitochondrial n=1 Tax=Ignelater luminosus TaxID=2038154 RepID=A0A8K0DM15_IGNLU|nr:hypothetical protein ILUMI_00349 [Ignelater luminosus]
MFSNFQLIPLLQKLNGKTNISKLICDNRKIHRSSSFESAYKSQQTRFQRKNLKSTLNYVTAAGALALSVAYTFVPLYRLYCQSHLGATTHEYDEYKVGNLTAVKTRPITVKFNADTVSSMKWNFKPQQNEITVYPGETALAFYTARNPSNRPITGISTYNILPFEAGQYFNKIQCFCFEEQQLNPHEQVDMPVFFYIDPEFIKDPRLSLTRDVILSYTFFEAREGMKLPVPSFARR